MNAYLVKRIWRAAVFVCFLGAISAAIYLWYMEEQGNFHPITIGEAYRSAQMDRDELAYYITTYGLRSVVNLRGQHTGDPWYEEEIATCKKMGIKHYDIVGGLCSTSAPSSFTVKKLLQLFQIVPRPVLFHCQGGADRSGLAAAFWKFVIDGVRPAVAKKQLSILYGHLPFGQVHVLDTFFDYWTQANPTKMNVTQR